MIGCEYCHSIPHLSGCPNAPEPSKVYTCKHCGEDIIEGDEYIEHNGEYYHRDCLYDAASSILVESYGAIIHKAQESKYPMIVGKCVECFDDKNECAYDIWSDEDYVEYNGNLYHYECFESIADELLRDEVYWLCVQTAELDDGTPEYDPGDNF